MLTCNRHRHELNHNPKQIYHCTFPNCTRTFVRQDLFKRHKNRHAAKGSRLNKNASIVAQSEIAQIRTPNSLFLTTRSPTVIYSNGNMSKRMYGCEFPNQGLDNRIPLLAQPQSPSIQTPYASAGYLHFDAMPSIANQQGLTIQQNMAQLTFFSQQNVGSMDWPLGQYVHGLNPVFVTSAKSSEPRIPEPGDKMMTSPTNFPNMATSHFDNPLGIQAQHNDPVSTLISHARSQDAGQEDKFQKHQPGHRKIERGVMCGRGVSDKICYTRDNSDTRVYSNGPKHIPGGKLLISILHL